MDCRTAESMVSGYIQKELNDKELDAFLKHIENCSSCYDELETYYIVYAATKQLDENQEDSIYDFKGMLQEDIRKTKVKIQENKIFSRLAFLLASISVITFIVYVTDLIIDFM